MTIKKPFGTLHILLTNGKRLYYENVLAINLINGIYYIFVMNHSFIEFSKKQVCEFNYLVTHM